MKQTKRRMETLAFFNKTGIEKHLEKMARRGWLIESISNFGWVYRKIEPKSLRFAVTYYPKASEFDPEPSRAQRTLHDFCAHTGWELACTWAQMQVFYNGEPDPVPIETDPLLEIETMQRAMRKNFLPSYYLLLAVALLNGWQFLGRLVVDTVDLLSSPTSPMTGFVWLLLMILIVTELSLYFIWRSRARRAAQRGEFLDTPDTSKLQAVILAMACAAGLFWLLNVMLTGDSMLRWVSVIMIAQMGLLLYLVNTIKKTMKKHKISAGINRTVTLAACFVLSFALMGGITWGLVRAADKGFFDRGQETYEYRGQTWVLYRDELPLSVEEMVEVDTDAYTKRSSVSESIFLGCMEVTQRQRFDNWDQQRLPDLEYEIVIVKWPFLYDMCKRELFFHWDETQDDSVPEGHKLIYIAQDPDPWGAQEVYRLHAQQHMDSPLDWYLLCYEDRIIEIQFDWEPTPEHMALVGEKLGQ